MLSIDYSYNCANILVFVDLINKMIRLLFRNAMRFTKITPEIFPQIKMQF